jgi:hypothetical protein
MIQDVKEFAEIDRLKASASPNGVIRVLIADIQGIANLLCLVWININELANRLMQVSEMMGLEIDDFHGFPPVLKNRHKKTRARRACDEYGIFLKSDGVSGR